MNTKNLLSFAVILLLGSACVFGQIFERTDTLFIPETLTSPAIDGSGEDAVWNLTDWHPIDQIWMPWGNSAANLGQSNGLQLWEGPDDFTGKYKVLWSSQSNLLYFLVEIVDDVFVDGFLPGGSYPDYDIVEVFIDEDRSGGPHVFDNVLYPGMSACPTCNAENAFSYHLAANAKDDGEIQDKVQALDIAGSNWGTVRDYASHLPEFAMVKNENTYVWEFSLIVHNDTYNHNNQTASRVTLEEGKIMGLSMAYCDNDNPFESPLRRDHFFGSVEVPLAAHNSHWINANWFGAAKLVENPSTDIPGIITKEIVEIRSYFANRNLYTTIQSQFNGPVNIRVVNILGNEVYKGTVVKNASELNSRIPLDDLKRGIYIVEIIHNNVRKVEKVSVQ